MFTRHVQVKECPYCKGRDFETGIQRGHGKIFSSIFGLGGANIHHQICMECGSIVHSRISNPVKFRKEMRS